ARRVPFHTGFESNGRSHEGHGMTMRRRATTVLVRAMFAFSAVAAAGPGQVRAQVCEGPDLVGAPLDFAASSGFWRRGPALALGSGEMALAVPFSDAVGPAIQVQRLSLAGVPTGPPEYVWNPLRTSIEDPSIVWDGETYGLAW